MEKIRVLVCDDMPYICDFFEMLLNNSENCICVGSAHNEAEVTQQVKQLQPDIVLLDVQMDTEDSGLRLIPIIGELSPRSKIIIISVHEDSRIVFEAIKRGAKDYFVKNQPTDEIIETIERIHTENRNIIRGDIATKLIDQYEIIEERQQSLLYMFNKMIVLSQRELEILKELCDGQSYTAIAEKYFIEEVTVRTHINRILKKMEYKRISTLVEHLKKIRVFDLFLSPPPPIKNSPLTCFFLCCHQ